MERPTLAELRREPHVSFSSLNTFLNVCALQWAFRYVYGAEPAFTPSALAFGKAFHGALEFAFRSELAGRAPSAAESAACFRDLLERHVRTAEPAVRLRDGEDADALSATGARMLAAFLEARDPEERVRAVGVAFRVTLEDASGNRLEKPLIGEADCIVATPEGETAIVDWKTAARRWPKGKAETDLQGTCYLYAWVRRGGRADTVFRYDVVTKAKTPAVEHHPVQRTEDDFERMVRRALVMDRMVRRELFLPADGSCFCTDCPYAHACADWHRASARRHSIAA